MVKDNYGELNKKIVRAISMKDLKKIEREMQKSESINDEEEALLKDAIWMRKSNITRKNKGWHSDSLRHSLASKGVKTSRKSAGLGEAFKVKNGRSSGSGMFNIKKSTGKMKPYFEVR